jgi:photosystem II stability/assembly factor-like uncharacterized protein
MEKLPNIVRERLKVPAGGDHPDADLLTAFAERALPEQERSHVLTHLSSCADCRDVVALAVPPATGPASLDTARPAPWFQWRVLRWGAAVACVAIVGSAVLLRRDAMTPQRASIAVVREEPQAEQFAYERSDRLANTSPSRQMKESIPSAMRVETDKDAGRLRDRALKAVVSPKLPAAPPPPAQAFSVPDEKKDEKKQVAGGALGASAAGGTFITGMKKHEAEGWAAATPPIAEKRESAAESRAATDLSVLSKSTETVEVPSASAPASTPAPTLDNELSADKREAIGKAKVANGAMPGLVESESYSVAQNQATRSEETAAQKMDRSKLRRSLVSRWTISADGQLQHSIDAGQTWQPVTVADKASFRALSANGPDIWVGGAAGLLYHSRDSGFTWTQVKPSSAATNLSADISAIEFTDILHGKITTANGENWTTEDAGQSWRKQP